MWIIRVMFIIYNICIFIIQYIDGLYWFILYTLCIKKKKIVKYTKIIKPLILNFHLENVISFYKLNNNI